MVHLPSPEQLREVAKQCGLSLSDDDLTSFRSLMAGSIAAYNAIDALPDEIPEVKYPRTPGYQPDPAENKHNAWHRKTAIRGAATGKLKGKRIAIKDNVMVAGVPMMNGASTLERFVPDFDASIVTRMLDAGAEIVGKTIASISACQAVVTPTRPDPCTILTKWGIRPAVPPPVAPWSWRWGKPIWRSAATRADRSACLPLFPAFMASNPRGGSFPIRASCPSKFASTIPVR